MGTPEFPRRDPSEAEFWDLRYASRFAPWDAGRVPAQLQRFARQLPNGVRVLVPGCGSAWDVRFLADSGLNVTGLDFSAEAVAAARAILGPHGDRVQQADVFAPIAGAPFDLVYERAFLCALPPRLWPQWGRRMAEVVAPGGALAGYFFIDPAAGERGPPFALKSQATLAGLLEPDFKCEEDAPAEDSIAVFAGRERWQRWRRC
jgi:hypothetical protein